ncbi:hypothetical protein AAVH_35213 [Aphelenchoides avenae]|nr:hypothetical protein AAVH_35213 [Aphelenchus avenae]
MLARVAGVNESAFRRETTTSGSRLAQGLIAPNPSNRLTAQAARGTPFFYLVASEANKKGPKYIVHNPFDWKTLDSCRRYANASDLKEFEQRLVWLSADKKVGGSIFIAVLPLPNVLCGRRSAYPGM